jgi:Flp pilus assembly protein TadG
MSNCKTNVPGSEVSTSSLLAKWKRNQTGSTTIEMGFVALPFLMFLFAILGYSLHFYTQTVVDHAVESASRMIRTGEAQNAGLTMADFKTAVCDAGTSMIDCDNVRVHIDSGATWAAITPTPCLNNSQQLSSEVGSTETVESESGGRDEAVVITVCYEWQLASALPFLMLGNMSGDSALIQSVAAFRSEPF